MEATQGRAYFDLQLQVTQSIIEVKAWHQERVLKTLYLQSGSRELTGRETWL